MYKQELINPHLLAAGEEIAKKVQEEGTAYIVSALSSLMGLLAPINGGRCQVCHGGGNMPGKEGEGRGGDYFHEKEPARA